MRIPRTPRTPITSSLVWLRALPDRLADRLNKASIWLWLAISLTLSPHLAWATGLPTMPTPGTDMQGRAVADGDWLGSMSAWFKKGIVILGLILVGVGFLYVVGGALSKWRDYSRGKAELSDLKEYFIMGSIFAVFLIMLMTYAFKVIGEN